MTDWEHYDRFVAFCTQLRLLGATEVTSGALHAKFSERVTVRPPQPEPEQPEAEPAQLTPEQAREKAYAEELGREYKPPA